jgi:hypothetical protein
MPSLESLLRENEVAYAILERPAPSLGTRASAEAERTERAARALSSLRILAAAAIPFVISAVGWTLFVESVTGGAVRANAYVALSLGLGGLVLLWTLILAVKD